MIVGPALVALAVLFGMLFDRFATRDAFGVSNDTWAGLAATAFSMLVVLGLIVMIHQHLQPT